MKRLYTLLLIISLTSYAKESEEKEEEADQVKIGNLLLAGSQQPSPMVGFGQNIVDKNDFLFYLDNIYTKKRNQEKLNAIVPFILYGIRDDFSLLVSIPCIIRAQSGNIQSAGVGDITAQLEYAFYTKNTKTYTNQITALAHLSVPSGEFAIAPRTGFGAISPFIGVTAGHIDPKWYYFGILAAEFPFKNRNSKVGDIFYYQAGISRNIGNPGGTILNWMLEIDGYYFKPDIINGVKDPNSGSNIIFFGPSIYFATERTFVQVGAQLPIYQRLSGIQNKYLYYFEFLLSWKFNVGKIEKKD